ncbi:MAG: hypothetical protein JWM19_4567, partial [Actinomycetia bacterium]|nr:hypothetical protein [Actinomycetes bacterium]
MGSGRHARGARRNRRAHEFGVRHPRLTGVIVCVLLAGAVAICGFQLSYGTYLGRGWVIAAVAGMAIAVALGAAAVITNRRHSPAARLVAVPWLVVSLASTSAIKLPFPQESRGGVQAFFNAVHAALLGWEALTCTALVASLAYLILRPRGRAPRAVPATPSLQLPARLRFPEAKSARWRPGQLLAATNGTVTWLSWKGDTEVDLTSACQALSTRPPDARGRRPRKTTLATASGLAEVGVSPRALALLIRDSRRPPYEET